MGLILDTCVLIAAERGKLELPALLKSHGTETVYIASITASELLHGVERANTPERRERRAAFVESLLRQIPILDFGLHEARAHARIWAALDQSGKPIGPHDMLIAATAVAGAHSLATLNQAEFARVPALALVDVNSFLSKQTQ